MDTFFDCRITTSVLEDFLTASIIHLDPYAFRAVYNTITIGYNQSVDSSLNYRIINEVG